MKGFRLEPFFCILLFMKFSFLLILTTMLSFSCHLQENKSGLLENYLNDLLTALPGENEDLYQIPDSLQLEQWATIIQAIQEENTSLAHQLAANLNYQILRFSDSSQHQEREFWVLEEKNPQQHYWGSYIFNPNACRSSLVLQAPHSKYDFNTGKQAVYNFIRLDCYALMLNGAHRCNHTAYSSCSGTTSVCDGSSASFRASDQAHMSLSCFQKTTEVLLENHYFIQLHGFSKLASDPYVIISNGTRNKPVEDKISSLVLALQTIDPTLTFKVAHEDLDWDRLLAFTNVQGRMINGNSFIESCTKSADQASGHFIHIEQEKERLRADSSGWHKMYLALSETFDCQASAQLKELTFQIYPNPNHQGVLMLKSQAKIQKIKLINELGQVVQEWEHPKSELQLRVPKGLYLIWIQTDRGCYSEKIYIDPS
ncbi:MAG: T9SS type A sorting domain-containing protein [Bacteroidetes bacterium]|nr:MAG: T9SS type A sorting domain-containing protein [Bacteroidota bacterium]